MPVFSNCPIARLPKCHSADSGLCRFQRRSQLRGSNGFSRAPHGPGNRGYTIFPCGSPQREDHSASRIQLLVVRSSLEGYPSTAFQNDDDAGSRVRGEPVEPRTASRNRGIALRPRGGRGAQGERGQLRHGNYGNECLAARIKTEAYLVQSSGEVKMIPGSCAQRAKTKIERHQGTPVGLAGSIHRSSENEVTPRVTRDGTRPHPRAHPPSRVPLLRMFGNPVQRIPCVARLVFAHERKNRGHLQSRCPQIAEYG